MRYSKKNDNFLEVVLEGTTIKITLKKKGEIYVGLFKGHGVHVSGLA